MRKFVCRWRKLPPSLWHPKTDADKVTKLNSAELKTDVKDTNISRYRIVSKIGMDFTRWFNLSWLLILLCFGAAAPAAAQYRFDHWTADNGLPQNSVRDIVQTQDGYLWFTTFDGLVRFDGVRFTVFNKSNSPGLASNRFVSLFEDRWGDLWAALETGEVVRRHQGRFTTYNQAQGLPGGGLPGLADDGHGNMVIYYQQFSTNELGKVYTRLALRAYRWSEDRFQPAEELSSTFSGPLVSAEEANRFTFNRVIEGDYWFSTPQRVIHLVKGGGIQVYGEGNGLPGTKPGLVTAKDRPPQAVSRDAAGRLWLTDLKSTQSQLLSLQTPEGLDVYGGYADNEGNYWFSTYNSGLFRARRQAVTPYGKAQGLNFSEIYPLYESRDGSLWIGAYGEGVFRLKDGAFTQYPAPKNKGLNSFGGFVSSLYEDRAGQLWVNGIWRLADGRFVPGPWTNALLDQRIGYVWTMCEDREGAYWLGADSGVVRYLNGALTQYATTDGLAGNDTKVIIEDGQGGLWLGSYGGLTHYKDGKFTAWTEKDGLPGATVRALKQDGDSTLWIGTYDSGLGRFSAGEGKEDCDARPQGGDLGQGEVDEDHTSLHDVNAEVGMDAGEDQAGREGRGQELEDLEVHLPTLPRFP